MDKRLCKILAHNRQPILGVCLSQQCSQNPYFCKYCFEETHSGHLYLEFEQLEKMGKIALSSPSDKISTFSAVLAEKANTMTMKSLDNLITYSITMLHEEFKNQASFCKVLKNSDIKGIFQEFYTPKQISQDLLNHYLTTLRLYIKKGFPPPIEQTSLNIMENIEKMVISSCMQIKSIIQKLAYQIHSFRGSEVLIQINQEMIPENKIIDLAESAQLAQLQQLNKQEKMLLKYNLFRKADNQQERMQKVIFRETKESKVNKLISQIDVVKIKELTIINSATNCAINQESVQQISKMVNLRLLRIFWVKGLTERQAIGMLKFMTHLQELCLAQFDQCTPLFVTALKINNPSLKKVVFTIDLKHCIRYNQQNMELMLDRVSYYNTEDFWIVLTNGLQQLTNIELNHPQNKKHWVSYLKSSSKTLKEFSLLACTVIAYKEKAYKPKTTAYSYILKALNESSNTSLQCLRFEQVTFVQSDLQKIIQRNPHLLSLIVNECPSITDKCYQAIYQNCPKFQELSVCMDDNFTLSALRHMTALKTLVLTGCWAGSQENFIQGIAKLRHLKCLNIEQNSVWVTGKSIKALGALPHLKVLNISSNKLQKQDIEPLVDLTKLATLICHDNSFYYNDLLNFPFKKSLKKLSISKNIKTNKQYQKIETFLLVGFSALTHLKLIGFQNIKPSDFELMERLICVTVADSPQKDIEQLKKHSKTSEIFFNYEQ